MTVAVLQEVVTFLNNLLAEFPCRQKWAEYQQKLVLRDRPVQMRFNSQNLRLKLTSLLSQMQFG
eukprot:jgi/Phyca11/511483/fgenesh2_kg.PHYCAscaffold_86_\